MGAIWFLTVLANCGGHLVSDHPCQLWGPVDQWAKYNKPAAGLVDRWAGVHESPLIGETAVIGRGGTTSHGRGGVGWSRMIMMATKMRRDSI